ncbi:MAG: hypothetical protein N2V78_07570 [Methanophagales archaeon]|nr:hypothetical protein [Methanophagales archaeon]
MHWHYAASIHPLSKEHFDSRLSSPVNYSTSYGSCSIRASRCTFSTYGNGFKRRFFISSITIVNNPADNLKAEEKIEVVRFIVPLEEWKNKGAKIGG